MRKQEGCFLSFVCIVYIVYNKLFPHSFFFCISMTSVLTYVNNLFDLILCLSLDIDETLISINEKY